MYEQKQQFYKIEDSYPIVSKRKLFFNNYTIVSNISKYLMLSLADTYLKAP